MSEIFGTQGPGGGGGGGGSIVTTDGSSVSVDGTRTDFIQTAKAPVNLIPQMTSPTEPSGVASDGGNLDNVWNAWRAMTISNANQGWLYQLGSQDSAWIQYQFPTAKTVRSFSIIPWSVDSWPDRNAKTFRLLGSNNGTDFDELGSYTCDAALAMRRTLDGKQWTQWRRTYFSVTTPGSYTHYRLKVDTINGGTYNGITELALYETA